MGAFVVAQLLFCSIAQYAAHRVWPLPLTLAVQGVTPYGVPGICQPPCSVIPVTLFQVLRCRGRCDLPAGAPAIFRATVSLGR